LTRAHGNSKLVLRDVIVPTVKETVGLWHLRDNGHSDQGNYPYIDNAFKRDGLFGKSYLVQEITNNLVEDPYTIRDGGNSDTGWGKWIVDADLAYSTYETFDPYGVFREVGRLTLTRVGTYSSYRNQNLGRNRDLANKSFTVSLWAKSMSGTPSLTVTLGASDLEMSGNTTVLGSDWKFITYTKTFSSSLDTNTDLILYLGQTNPSDILITWVQVVEKGYVVPFLEEGFNKISCVQMDGIDDYIATGNNLSILNLREEVTLEIFLNITNIGGSPYDCDYISKNTYNGFRIGHINNVIRASVKNATGFNDLDYRLVSGPQVLVMTYSAFTGLMKFYKNGEMVSSSSVMGTTVVSKLIDSSLGSPLVLGVGGPSWYEACNIYSSRVYARALTDSEILKNFNARYMSTGYVKDNSLVLDVNITKQKTTYPVDVSIVKDYSDRCGLVFDGTNDYVTVDHNEVYNLKTFTFDLFLRLNQLKDYGCLIQKGTGGGVVDLSHAIWTYANGNIDFAISDGVSASSFSIPFTPYIDRDTHIVYTFDGTTGKVFLNGVLANSHNFGGKTPYFNTLPFRIGLATASPNAVYYSTKVYNRALIESEITQNYNNRYNADGYVVDNSLVMDFNTYKQQGKNSPSTTSLVNSGSHRCLRFDGVSDCVEIADNEAFNFGSGDFAVEVHVKRNTIGTSQVVIEQCDSSETLTTLGFGISFNALNKLQCFVGYGSSSVL
jgi:hypothetical protein